MAGEQITHAFETLSVAQAKQILAANSSNRSISPTTVDKYLRNMQNGQWDKDAISNIVIAADGTLLDGQHRLTAQVRFGQPMRWLVIRNVPNSAQKALDMGKPRNAADALALEGEKNTGMLSSVARKVYAFKNNLIAGGATVSTPEVMEILEAHPDIRHSTEIAEMSKRKTLTPIAPSVFGVAHWMIAQENGHADADIFMWRCYNLTNEGDGSPVLALARRCNEIRRQQQRVHHRDYLAMVIKAWNLDAKGKKAGKIETYSRTGTYVLPEVVKRKVSLVDTWDGKTEAIAEGGQEYVGADDDD